MVAFPSSVLSGAADRLSSGPDPMWTDPSGWARHNMTGWNPAPYQDMIGQALAKYRKVSVVGPHGIGKTADDAIIVFWFALTREMAGIDWKVVTTAGAWRQLQRYLWPEIHKWARRLKNPLWRDALLSIELKLGYGQAFAVASDDPANIEGAHADEILYIIDEAKNVIPDTWDAIEGAMSSGNAYCLANSTPGKAEGRLYDIHRKMPGYEDWHTIHVTLEDAIAAGRIRREWAEARARQWGVNSPMYLNRVLGQFSTSDSDGVIPLEWLEAANERWEDLAEAGKLEDYPLTAVAADVASEEGVDASYLALRYGPVISQTRRRADVDTMKLAGEMKAIIDAANGRTYKIKPKGRQQKAMAVVDVIGVGTGVVDRLREQHIKVDAFQAAGKALKSDRTGELKFLNRRAEGWWNLADMLNPAFGDSDVAIPGDEEHSQLLGDLIAPKYEQMSSGFIKIEDKDDIIQRLGRSPDEGEAVVMAMAARLDRRPNLADMKPVGISQKSRWIRSR